MEREERVTQEAKAEVRLDVKLESSGVVADAATTDTVGKGY